ncbi:DUF7452 domain-containing protein [Nocardia arthritidis]|uniref:DUF7452 domain-containing protein n=1 Tax=Nocardia arthritidis TaxID=228602 RepID=A0A6G9YNF1_9NOCA|nr:hypothetical protein [Nocardia arthritidis]QIS14453.1 hypothetical protein F5544_33080 [Nocardia arthritidis]
MPVQQAVFWHSRHVTNPRSRSYYGDRTDIIEYAPQDPDAVVFATAAWDSHGPGGLYVDDLPSIFWDSGPRCWCVYNASGNQMEIGSAFNVLYTLGDPNAFVVKTRTSDPAVTNRNVTYIDHDLTDHNPDALLLVNACLNPGATGVTRQYHPIGVWYDPVRSKWAIFNQDMHPMEDNLAFNVKVFSRTGPSFGSYAGFVHIAQPINSWSNFSYLTHEYCDGYPDRLVFVTPVWESADAPGPTGGVFFPSYYGVRYAPSLGKWVVFNQAGAFSQYVQQGTVETITLVNKNSNLLPERNAIPPMAAFHVLVVNPT